MSPTRSYFIAGTDTEIGKTYTTCALLHHARGTGARVLGMKPVAAGAEEVDGRPRNQDALALIRASSFAADYDLVNPVCLTEAVAPHIAAADEGRQIDAATILAARDSLAEHADLLLIEGVGGFRVPLQLAYDTADLAVDLAAPVILVVGLRLGCINHALLTAEAIRARGLELVGWIGNGIDAQMSRRDENIAALDERLGCERLGVLPHDATQDPAANAGLLRLPAASTDAADAIVLLDSAAGLHAGHHGRVVVTGSHGGVSAARYALRAGPRLSFFNDAGHGKADAGIAALAILQQAGLAAACYRHDSARIGDARDGFGHGNISAMNDAAAALGLRVGMSVAEAASRSAAHAD
ncbi:MAG: dethiobiotin synthase [Rhodocyclaceae bacterium]|nr:dethiobiotin synthase [Rhodocyclaceae bacterium]